MADNKASFLLYADLIHTVKKLPAEKAGELFFTILQYVNDLNPEVTDPLIDIVFEPIKHQLKRDLLKWETKLEARSKAGKASAEARQKLKELETNDLSFNNSQHMLTHVESVTQVEQMQQVPTNSTVNVTDTVTVNDTVTDTVIINDNKPMPKPNAFNFYAAMSEVKTVLARPSQWQDVFCMQNQVKQIDFPKWLDKFYNHAILTGKDYKQLQPFQEHFSNWIRKQEVYAPIAVPEQGKGPETPTERRNRLAAERLKQQQQ